MRLDGDRLRPNGSWEIVRSAWRAFFAFSRRDGRKANQDLGFRGKAGEGGGDTVVVLAIRAKAGRFGLLCGR